MPRILILLLSALLVVAGAQAATTNTTLTVNVSAALSGVNVTVTGTANLSGIGNGTVNESLSAASLIGATGNVSLPLPVVLSGGTLNISLSVPSTLLFSGGGPISGSGTVTGGTGSYSGASGSFGSLSGTASGSIATPGGSVTLAFSGAGTVTTSGSGGGGGTTTPTITDVLDDASNTANIAQGSLFIVKGSNLSPSGYTPVSSLPLPKSIGGVKITFTPTGGGSGTDTYLFYTYNQSGVNQLGGVLPSSVQPGNYNVTVTNGTAVSPGVPATVVATKVGIFTQDTTGTGLAVVQNYVSAARVDMNRFTTGTVSGVTISPAKPGQVLIAWGTGLGKVPFADNDAAPSNPPYAFSNVQVIVGGMSITPAFAGRVPTLAGEDEIVFTLPSNVPTGCTVSFQISVAGVLSAPTFIAIAPDANSTACVQPGYTTQQLQDFDNGKITYSGGFNLSQFAITAAGLSVKSGTIGGGFYATTGFQLASAPQATVSVSNIGSCQVIQSSGNGDAAGGGNATGLDAGTVTMSGPGISGNLTVTQDPTTKTYYLLLGGGFGAGGNVSIGAGTYNINGAGGKDVGSFSTSLTIGSPLTITGGLPSSVTRSSGLKLSWTGGLSSDLVEIFGSSSTGAGANTTTTTFVCLAKAGDGTFTVPSSVLSQLPAISANAASGSGGMLAVLSGPTPSTFSAPLTAGGSITNATFSALAGTGGLVSYQ
jgi:uncharacterized protein (TIGR03437 family)